MGGIKPYQPGIGLANRALAKSDGLLQGIVNPDILLCPLITQEAVLSSRIEGTQATLEDVLQFEATKELVLKQSQDILEIINYRKALKLAIDELKKGPYL